jgi:hypothetical protein
MRPIKRFLFLLCAIIPLAGCDLYNAYWEIDGNRPDIKTSDLVHEISEALAPLGFTIAQANGEYFAYETSSANSVRVVVGPNLWIAVRTGRGSRIVVNQALDAIQQRIKARYGVTITWKATLDLS